MSSNEAPPEHMVNFGCGHPQASLLPVQQVAAATTRALLQRGSEFLQYGSEIGQPYAREQLAAFLSSEYQFQVTPDTLALTTGVTHGIQLVAQTLKRRSSSSSTDSRGSSAPLCWVEEPTYFLVPHVFQQAGYELATVPTNAQEGLDVDSLEPIFQKARETDPTRTLVLYCIPTHHNPLGTSLSEDHRRNLVELCEQYQVYLIADEVYHGLSFDNNESSPFIRTMAMRSSYAVSISAMTKILCPGIRCGWIHATPQMISWIRTDAVNDSQGCACQLASGIVAEMIASQEIKPILTILRQELSQRCQHLCNLLLQQPLLQSSSSSCNDIKFQLHQPQGGYFVWVELQGANFDVNEEFRLWCRQEFDVDFKTGDTCSSVSWNNDNEGDTTTFVGDEKKYTKCLRLCFAYYDIPKLTEGVQRLCRAIEAYTNKVQKVQSSFVISI